MVCVFFRFERWLTLGKLPSVLYEKRPFSSPRRDSRARRSRPASNGLNAALRVLSGSEEFLTLGLFSDVLERTTEESSELPEPKTCPSFICLNAFSETDFSEIRLRLRRDAPSQSLFNISSFSPGFVSEPAPLLLADSFLVVV